MKVEYAAEYAAELEKLNKEREELGGRLKEIKKRHDYLVSYFRVQKNRGKITEEEFMKLRGKRRIADRGCVTPEAGCEFCRRKWDPQGLRFDNCTEVARGGWVGLYYGVDEFDKPYLFAEADDDTDPYYPKFCPECGRDLRDGQG